MTRMDNIIASIDGRLRQLNEEIRALSAARPAPDGRDAPAMRRPQRKPARRVSRAHDGTGARTTAQPVDGGAQVTSSESSRAALQTSRVRAKPERRPKGRPVDVVPADRLEALLSEHGGMTTSALAERAKGKRDQILSALRELEAAGRVRRSGQRRSTRWHAITDEERIQKRAAELAARSKTAG